jgi:TusA-related sulfurtransferase
MLTPEPCGDGRTPLPMPPEQAQGSAPTCPADAPTRALDLRGIPCPLNLVKAKLAIENIRVGEVLEIRLDGGEPIMNLPVSLARQGQEILGTTACDGHFRVTVRRTL